MAVIVPRSSGPTVQANRLPDVRNTARVDMSPVIGGVGHVGEAVSDVLKQQQDRIDTARMQEAQNALTTWRNNIDDPNNADGLNAYKGEHGLDASSKLLPSLDDTISEATKSMSQHQRESFAPIASQFKLQQQSYLQRYGGEQNEIAVKARNEAFVKVQFDSAIRYGMTGDAEGMQNTLGTLIAGEEQAARANGMPKEYIDAIGPQRQSAAYRAAIIGRAQAGDVNGAIEMLDANRDKLSRAEDLIETQQAIRPFVDARHDDADYEAFKSPTTGGRLPYSETDEYVTKITANSGNVTGSNAEKAAKLLPALIRQESGGNPNAVSPKGARGIAQIMPATAANPGLPGVKPIDLATATVDEQKAFATQYLTALLDRYGGDTRKALAAYNAGPGAVDSWVKRGIFDAPVAPNAAPQTESAMVDAIRERYADDPEKRARLTRIAREDFARRDQAERDQLSSIYEKVEASAPGAKLHTFLSPAEQALLRKNGKFEDAEKRQTSRYYGALPQDDPEYIYSLESWKLRDPAEFAAKFNPNDPTAASKLSVATRQKLASDVATLRKGGEAADNARQDWASESERMQSGFRALGIDGTKKKDEQGVFAARYRMGLRNLILMLPPGKKPSPEQLDALLQSTVSQYHRDPERFKKTTQSYEKAMTQSITLSDGRNFSGQDVAEMRAALERAGKPSSPQDILSALTQYNR